MNSRLLNQITVEHGIGETRVAIWKVVGNRRNNTQDPYLARQLSVFFPQGVTPTSKTCMRAPFSRWWCKKDTEIYPGSGKRRPYVQRGGCFYYLAPKCLYRGEYKVVWMERQRWSMVALLPISCIVFVSISPILSWASPFIVPRGDLGYMRRWQSRGR